jgi:hypothetical protein
MTSKIQFALDSLISHFPQRVGFCARAHASASDDGDGKFAYLLRVSSKRGSFVALVPSFPSLGRPSTIPFPPPLTPKTTTTATTNSLAFDTTRSQERPLSNTVANPFWGVVLP